MNEAEKDAFRSWLSLSLARDANSTIATLTKTYTPGKLREAHQWLALAKALEDGPHLAPIPEEHDQPTCNNCGRTEEHSSGGLTGVYKGPQVLTTTVVPGKKPGDIPEIGPAGSHHKPPAVPDVPVTPADLHCANEAACDAHRASQLEKWREKWKTAEEHQRQQKLLGSPERFGYHGRPFTAEPWTRKARPAWLSQVADQSEILLAGYEIVQAEVSAWVELTRTISEREEEWLALAAPAVPPLTGQFATATSTSGNWDHTLRNPANRGHTLGAQLSAYPGSSAAPDVLAAKATGRKPKASQREQELARYRARRKAAALRFRHRPP